MKKKVLYQFFGRFFPRVYKKKLEKLLYYAGEKENLYGWLGASMILALLFGIIPVLYSFAIYRNTGIHFYLFGVFGFFLGHFLTYLLAHFRMEDRTKRIEESLPDFLQLMAANVRAGMTPFQAMKLSAREEFGPLKEEIDYATSKALGTDNFSKVLLKIREHVKSDTVDRAIELLSSSLKAGGKLAVMLEDLAMEVAEMQRLKQDLVTSTKTYAMFIFFTVLVGAPMLLAISTYFLTSIIDLQASSGIGGDSLIGEIVITVAFFNQVAIVFLVLTAIFSSMLVGVIKEGKYLHGIRYSPVVMFGAVTLFYLFRSMISGFLG
jgi:archaeal flagellar protein FlaJ